MLGASDENKNDQVKEISSLSSGIPLRIWNDLGWLNQNLAFSIRTRKS